MPSPLRFRLPPLCRYYSVQPPPGRPYKPGTPKSSTAEAGSPIETPASPSPTQPRKEPLDPQRGRAASQRYVETGVLDPRYKKSSRQVISIICAIPVLVVTSWVLYQRQFLGVERKRIVKEGSEKSTSMEDQDVVVVREG